MKKIVTVLYDNQALFNDNKYGIKNFIKEIINKTNRSKVEIKVIPSLNIINDKISYILNKIISIILLKTINYDIFIPTYYDNYFLKFIKKDFILIIYDMTPEIIGGEIYFKTIENKKKLIPKSKHIIVISKKTKSDLLKYFPNIDKKKITIAYPSSSIDSNIKNKPVKELKNNNFLTYVGNRNLEYKKFKPFLIAISDLLKNNNLKLFCVGGGNFTNEENFLIKNLKLEKNVFQKKINKNELKWTYRNTKLLIFPSSHEGFGLPIIEAQSNKCPVMCSDISIFGEIAGKNSSIFFKKDDFSDLKNKLDLFLKLKKYEVKNMVERGFMNSKKYSWNKSAKIISNVCMNINMKNL